ncbi:MAG: hypothetical protein ACYDBB_25410 [Armatimonadota bacterium]
MFKKLVLFFLAAMLASAMAAPLQTFTLKERLNHRWIDELVHFDFAVTTTARDMTLVDADGVPLPCQFTDITRDEKLNRVSGKVWTVVTLEPYKQITLELQPGKPPVAGVTLKREGDKWTLRNTCMAISLPQLPGALAQPVDLVKLPAPFSAVSADGEKWLGNMRWVNSGPPLQVKEATTTIVEQGSVRVIIRQKVVFTDGGTYEMTIQLAERQEAALISETSNMDAPKAALAFGMVKELEADRVIWHNQWKKSNNADTWELVKKKVFFDVENRICRIRPWSFWWEEDITEWMGFSNEFGESLVGVLALRPSRWRPDNWDGHQRTEIPVVAGPGPRLDLTFKLLAIRKKGEDGKEKLRPLHREWAVTVGKALEHLDKQEPRKLRRQLIKYSEFPLDEVKDYGYDFTPTKANRTHPFLLVTREDIVRVRRQMKTVPGLKAQIDKSIQYIGPQHYLALQKEGWQSFYDKNYLGNYLIEALPEAYIGSEDPQYGEMMAAAVKGLAREVRLTFLETPSRPAIGAYGPWFSETMTRLVTNYDLIAGNGLLTPEDEANVRDVLVFGAHILSHPDYWNNARGLCSANPNMTSSILLPRGLLALLLDGHPEAPVWLNDAEQELKSELKDWISPGGAWVEDPGYQAASLDGMFLLAQALKNVTARDYFADPQFKATMDYYGFLLTPPDRRFPPGKTGKPMPMVLPSIGDMFAGFITCFNGWMAKATEKSDPAYSARQQFYWQQQGAYYGSSGRAKGFSILLTDAELPAAPPTEVARSFPGFGSILRTSWTDPKASYIAHRTGPNLHHYHDDYNEIVYYAKGVPLCTDFGNCYEPAHRKESWYHNRVSFNKYNSPVHYGSSGDILDVRTLPSCIDYSYGRSWGGNLKDHRHILLVKSADPLGANYVVMRDVTEGGAPDQTFFWNLFCLAKPWQETGLIDPEAKDGNGLDDLEDLEVKDAEPGSSLTHFIGQFGVDLDVHILSPVKPDIEKIQWGFKQHIYVWGYFKEEQYGIRIQKKGNAEDYFTVLYPRAPEQAAAKVTALAAGAGAKIEHMEGVDYLLLSPEKATTAAADGVQLAGEIAFVRKYTGGAIRLAVIKGKDAKAALGEWALSSGGAVSLQINGATITGESDGEAHTATITIPAKLGEVQVLLDGKPVEVKRVGKTVSLQLPAGSHGLVIKGK